MLHKWQRWRGPRLHFHNQVVLSSDTSTIYLQIIPANNTCLLHTKVCRKTPYMYIYMYIYYYLYNLCSFAISLWGLKRLYCLFLLYMILKLTERFLTVTLYLLGNNLKPGYRTNSSKSFGPHCVQGPVLCSPPTLLLFLQTVSAHEHWSQDD